MKQIQFRNFATTNTPIHRRAKVTSLISPFYKRFVDHINENKLFNNQHKVLLAISGGMDSMVMLGLFSESPFQFGVAHCNFQLRGQEADMDQLFVEQTARKKGVPFFTVRFNTKDHAAQRKYSTQMAARELRYDWLEGIRIQHGYDFIATAHHLDDSIETLIINLIRGTGITGLKGIPVRTGHAVRPILFATREEIAEYLQKKQLGFRADKSNTEDVYVRNKIRKHIITQLKEINPSLEITLAEFMRRMNITESIYRKQIDIEREKCIKHQGEEIHILIEPISRLNHAPHFLFEFLHEYSFTPAVCQEIIRSVNAQAGKTFYSNTHLLVRDRESWVLVKRELAVPSNTCLINPDTTQLEVLTYTMIFDKGMISEKHNPVHHKYLLMADLDKLHFPLTLRNWKPGDYLYPYGMQGRKKISDLLTDIKLPVHKKNEVMVLTSNDQVIWVVGIRSDNRYKIDKDTKAWFSAVVVPCSEKE